MLPELLSWHLDFGDELLVLDTGSTDGSQALVQASGARLEERAWPGSFAEARNVAIDLAQEPWILMLDADERLDPKAVPEVKAVAETSQVAVFQLIQRTYTDDAHLQAWRPAGGAPEARGRAGYFDGPLGRLFPKHPSLRFEGIIHELIEPGAQRAQIPIHGTPWLIHHYREAQSWQKQGHKRQLYLELSRQKVRLHPGSAKARIELSAIATVCGVHDEAVSALDSFVKLHPNMGEAAEQLATALLQAGRQIEVPAALQAPIARAQGLKRERLLCLLGEAQTKTGAYGQALHAFLSAPNYVGQSFRAQINLGVCCLGLGQLEWAESHLKVAEHLNPKSCLPPLNRALVYKAKGMFQQAEVLLQRAKVLEPSRWEVHSQLAGLAFELNRFDEALSHAEAARAIVPHGADAELRACAAAMALNRPEDALRYAKCASHLDPRHEVLVQELSSP